MTNSLPPIRIKRQTHTFFLTFAGAVIAFVVWSFFGRLDVVSFAVGEVVPSSQVKTVQHLEGGIISEILVREGDRVKAGQPLVSLESTASGADVSELQVRIVSLTADVARLEAEISGGDLVFPDGFEDENPSVARQTRGLFEHRRSQFENEIATQNSLITQRERERDEISARMQNAQNKLKLLREQIGISEELLKKDLTNRMMHLNLLKESASLEGTVTEDTAALNRLTSAIEQERLKLGSIEGRFRIEARQDLEEKQRSLDEFKNRVRKFEDSFERSVLTSPVDGVVMTLYVVTRGGVISPGGAVVDVVPLGDAMVIEAKLPPQDVGYIHPGQQARVKLASADGARFDNLDAEVVNISPDTVETKDGTTYYKVRLKTHRDYFESVGQRYQLVPGVEVMCSIVTGSRSVAEYITSPFIGSVSTALQER